jgi:hypothetical protein
VQSGVVKNPLISTRSPAGDGFTVFVTLNVIVLIPGTKPLVMLNCVKSTKPWTVVETVGPPFNDIVATSSAAHTPDKVALVKAAGRVNTIV